jgi:oligoribonuclease (3'-5' exoribonuclease)
MLILGSYLVIVGTSPMLNYSANQMVSQKDLPLSNSPLKVRSIRHYKKMGHSTWKELSKLKKPRVATMPAHGNNSNQNGKIKAKVEAKKLCYKHPHYTLVVYHTVQLLIL